MSEMTKAWLCDKTVSIIKKCGCMADLKEKLQHLKEQEL